MNPTVTRQQRSVPTGPHDPAIIAGYSTEMLDSGISSISNTPNAGSWEKNRLRMLKAERACRGSSPEPSRPARRPLDLQPCKD